MRFGWRERALHRLAGASAAWVVVAAGLSTGVVTLLDVFSEAEIAASLGYLLPISVAAWGMGRIGAAVCASVCATAWLIVELFVHYGDVAPGLQVVNLVVLTVTYLLFGQLLATVKELLEHERRLASTDPLTSLHNRRALFGAVGREVARGRRSGVPFSVAYLDVDGFKQVNDTLGHHAGDALLKRIGLVLQEDLRELDMVARPGGDEFVIVMPGTDEAGAGRVMQRLRKRLARAAWRRAFDIDFSIGVLTVRDAPESVEEVVARADQLMYQVKRDGRGMLLFDTMRAGDRESEGHNDRPTSGPRPAGGDVPRRDGPPLSNASAN